MKIKINDENGTALIAVLKLDGSIAVKGVDYALWEGTYHKNGKWSYTEGGVALHGGIVIFNQKSSHFGSNNIKRAYIVNGDTVNDYAPVIMGRWDETPQKPQDTHGYFGVVWDAILKAVLEWGRGRSGESRQKVEEMEARWDAISKFL